MIGPPYTSFIRVRIYAPLMGGIENPEKKARGGRDGQHNG